MTSLTSRIPLLSEPWALRAYALALIGLGSLQLVFGLPLAGRPAPWPSQWPGQEIFAYLTGVLFIVTGVLGLVGRWSERLLLTTCGFVLVWAGARNVARIVMTPSAGANLTSIGKAFTVATATLIVAYAVRRNSMLASGKPTTALSDANLKTGVRIAQFAIGAFLAISGIQHFLFLRGVALLVPEWMPSREPIAMVAGTSLFVCGTTIATGLRAQLFASIAAWMIGTWVFLVHLPRALANLHSSNEWTAVCEALMFSATLCLLARFTLQIRNDAQHRDD